MYPQNMECDSLFELVAELTSLLGREAVVETLETLVGVKSVEKDDCVYFDDVGLRFGDDGRVRSVFRTLDGSGCPDAFTGPDSR